MKSRFIWLVSLFVLVGCLVFVPAEVISQGGPDEITEIQYPEFLPKYFQLSKKMKETSGLIYFDGGFWTHNDSGGKPELYKVRPSDGVIVMTVVVENAVNVDWEDVTQDEDYFYIGDFGNNWGARRNLTIYKLRKKSLLAGEKVTIKAEIIGFSYHDQKSYTKNNRSHNFDCESIISYENELLLFTKNWINGNTRMYKLSKNPGKYKLDPQAEFVANGLITSADYKPETRTLALLGYTDRVPFVYLFSDFNGMNFETRMCQRINFPKMHNVQTEGICFEDDDQIAISAERTDDYKQAVYLMKIKEVLATLEEEKE